MVAAITRSNSTTGPAPLTLCVGEHLHPAGEHGPQHVVVLGEGAHGGVVEAAAHVELDVLRGGATDDTRAHPDAAA